MKNRKLTIGVIAAVVVVILILSSTYVVDMANYALVLQFGRVVTTHKEPGLYFKTPFIQSVVFIDRRLREWDGEPSNLYTAEKERIEVNTFARWRVTDPQRFYETTKTESAGQGVLDGLIDQAVKNVIATQPLLEALRNSPRRLRYTSEELELAEEARNIQIKVGRDRIVSEILEGARSGIEEKYGMEIEGIGIKHFNYVRDVIPKIYERMGSERMRIANLFESEGRESEARILGEMARDLEKIESEGEKQATILRGEADAEVVRIYAEAFGRDPEFYSFLRTLEAYPRLLGPGTKVVLGTEDSDLFRFLKSFRKVETGN